MKHALRVILTVAAMSAAGSASALEQAILVKVTDMTGVDSYEVMSAEELRSLEKQVREEGQLYRKAIEMAKKAWKENKETEKLPFPSSAVQPRQVRAVGRFKDRETADEKRSSYEEREAKSERDRVAKEQEREKRKLSRMSRDRQEEERAEMKREANEAADIAKRVQDLYGEILDSLKAPKEGGGEPRMNLGEQERELKEQQKK